MSRESEQAGPIDTEGTEIEPSQKKARKKAVKKPAQRAVSKRAPSALKAKTAPKKPSPKKSDARGQRRPNEEEERDDEGREDDRDDEERDDEERDDDADEQDDTDGDDEGYGREEEVDEESLQATERSLTKVSKKGASTTSLARHDPMQAYMRDVQGHPLLSRDEEHALAVAYMESGDLDAAARLVTANLRLVVKLAYEYRRAYRNMMDLVQEGNMGLMQAVKKYDPYRGVKLSSYAAWWIRAYMLRYILANWRMVKLGTTQAQRKLFFNLNKEKARLSAMGIEPSNAEIAKRLDVTETEVEEMDKRLSRGDASLDAPVNESDGRQIARVELLPSTGTTPELAAEGAELGHLLRLHLDEFRETLKAKDLQIFDERLVADEPRTLQELGDTFGVSRERVRQLEARITKNLRAFLSERLGDAVEVGDG